MKHIKTIKFQNLDGCNNAYFFVRADESEIAIGADRENEGDIEVGVTVDDCKAIIALLQQTIVSSVNAIHAPRKVQYPLVHRFKNLDGGADAAFQISKTDDSLEVILERSDEGGLTFRIKVEDAKSLVDALTSALQHASASAAT